MRSLCATVAMIKFASTHMRNSMWVASLSLNKSEPFTNTSRLSQKELDKENKIADLIDSVHGFTRSDMYASKLGGTVKFYERHVFLCYNDHESWPSQFESSHSDTLPSLLAMTVKHRQKDMPKKTLFTVCEEHDGRGLSNGDILIFPDMITYKGLTNSDIDAFVDEVLVKGMKCSQRTPKILAGTHIFVCGHKNRDKRCGICGPTLAARLREEVEAHGLQDHTSVSLCSHLGGHRYAGNLIIYTLNSSSEVSGHWYGYVSPGDVSVIFNEQIQKGEIVDRLWRGQMGLTETEQKKAQEERLTKDVVSKTSHIETDWDSGKNV